MPLRPIALQTVVFGLPVAVAVAPNTTKAETESLTFTQLEAPGECSNCHAYFNIEPNEDDPLIAPSYGWQGSLMANSARDPVFWAGFTIAAQDQVAVAQELGLDEVLTAECIRCHAPGAFFAGEADTITQMADLSGPELSGVECSLCHRMTIDPDPPDLPYGSGNARFYIDDPPEGQPPRRGPFDYEPGPGSPPHAFAQDPFTGSSELCGTCHDVSTPRPRLDDSGEEVTNYFNEQRTFSEWSGSALAVEGEGFRSCQDCHMPAVDNVAACDANNGLYPHKTGVRRHDLAGANRRMVALLAELYGEDGTGDVFDFVFDNALERIDAVLATAATLDVDAPKTVDVSAGLQGLTVTVTNNTGHKLPTGYSEGRVMWLEVVATYGEDVLFSSGLWNPTTGVQSDAQLRTYEAIAEDYTTNETFHLLLNNHWVVDSRIPPLGLVPDVDTDPVGDRYTLLKDGTWPNFDTVSYSFEGLPELFDQTPADATDDVLDVRVRLLYLINTPEYIGFLADENKTNNAGMEVFELFEAQGDPEPLVLGEQNFVIELTGFAQPPNNSGGTSAASSTGVPNEETSTTASDPTVAGPSTTEDSDESSGGTSGPGQGEDDAGCGCRNQRAMAPWGSLGLVVLLARRRRRCA